MNVSVRLSVDGSQAAVWITGTKHYRLLTRWQNGWKLRSVPFTTDWHEACINATQELSEEYLDIGFRKSRQYYPIFGNV